MINMINYYFAVLNLVGGPMTGPPNGPIGKFVFGDNQTPPTELEIQTEITRMKEEYSDNEYARNRANEYPSINELTVALYDTDDKAALETKRAAVKTKWPKDNTGPVE